MLVALLGLALASCGGGGGGDAPSQGAGTPPVLQQAGGGSSGTPAASHPGNQPAATTQAGNLPAPQAAPSRSNPAHTSPPPQGNDSKPAASLRTWKLETEADVSRFLAQAGFGGHARELKQWQGRTANAWIEEQFNKPQTRLLAIVDEWQKRFQKDAVSLDDTHNAWWYATLQDDPLRVRIAYALSQIFVVSSSASPGNYPRGMANYYDLLSRNAFGNFRQLLEDVTLNPMMGLYLTHLHNRRERFNNAGDQISSPDENYAREVMQLFTIGLEMLNPDGSVQRDGRGEPIPTYDNEDILGLARVFTGWGWSGPRSSSDCFYSTGSCLNLNPDRFTSPMQAYPQFHSTMEKRFLGVSIPAGQETPEANLKIALDTLFRHPNVGPFIGRQLIQRLVSSNPSPAYVQRVGRAFDDNGAGVRGDMKAVIRAVLLDPEARELRASDPRAGRIREPVLRFAHMLRAFETTSITGQWRIGRTDSANTLNQTVLRAPSVFNFYRPGFTPANTPVARAGLVAPEMQLANESSVAGYAGYLDMSTGGTSSTSIGIGQWVKVPDPADPSKTVNKREMQFNYEPLLALAANPEALVDHLDKLMLAGQMKPDTRRTIIQSISQITYPAERSRTPERIARIHWNRAGLAVYLSLMSTDYMVLK